MLKVQEVLNGVVLNFNFKDDEKKVIREFVQVKNIIEVLQKSKILWIKFGD